MNVLLIHVNSSANSFPLLLLTRFILWMESVKLQIEKKNNCITWPSRNLSEYKVESKFASLVVTIKENLALGKYNMLYLQAFLDSSCFSFAKLN